MPITVFQSARWCLQTSYFVVSFFLHKFALFSQVQYFLVLPSAVIKSCEYLIFLCLRSVTFSGCASVCPILVNATSQNRLDRISSDFVQTSPVKSRLTEWMKLGLEAVLTCSSPPTLRRCWRTVMFASSVRPFLTLRSNVAVNSGSTLSPQEVGDPSEVCLFAELITNASQKWASWNFIEYQQLITALEHLKESYT